VLRRPVESAVFLLVGVERHQHGGSITFVPLGLALVFVGLRRMRRAPPDPAR